MVNKEFQNIALAVSFIENGAVILSGGLGEAGAPINLLEALAETDIQNLTISSNNAGEGK